VRLGDIVTNLRKPATFASIAALAGFLCLTSGCDTSSTFGNGFLDPGEMMRINGAPILNVQILPNLLPGGADELDPEWADAREVRQADLKPSTSDYTIGRNDLLQISISDVAGQGVETLKTTRVTESGNITLPLIGQVKALGLTEAELDLAIANRYRERNIMNNAQVSSTVIEARGRTFSVMDAIARPGQYQILESDFRLMNAMTMAGGPTVQGIEYIYVIRKEAKPEGTTKPVAPEVKPDGTKPPVKDPLEGKPGSRGNFDAKSRLASNARVNPIHLDLLEDPPSNEGTRKVLIDGKLVEIKGPGDAKTPNTGTDTAKPADPLTRPADTTTITTPTPPVVTPANTTAGKPGAFAFDAPVPDPDIQVIRVPLEKLNHGELQYNIVIRPNDLIVVPSPKVGEYYMGGHVQRPGVYSLTGRQITLKEAIISAGMIDPLGWPERTEVVRRIGKDKEMFVRVNLPKIFTGEQSDIFLRPYDQVSVGTNMLAPFLAAIRGSFRFTYGFGFIYDRNFSPDANNNGTR